VRTKIQAQRKRLQKNLKMSKGGHGRKKKLHALDRLKDYEKNWVSSYNHMVSRGVVDFAIKNRAKYINIENLNGFKDSGRKFILRNWSYYQLQQDIAYKANMVGIEVRKVNPYYTSQICSCCGHWEEGQRKDQTHFICKSCGVELNADFNASRNIAMSNEIEQVYKNRKWTDVKR
jgi:IS605 OrfB family transposase